MASADSALRNAPTPSSPSTTAPGAARKAALVASIVAFVLAGGIIGFARANGLPPWAIIDEAGHALSRLGKTPRPAPPLPDDRSGRWRHELAYLATELPRLHANFDHRTAEARFRAAVAELDSRIPEMADHEIIVELMRLVAMTGDPRTNSSTWLALLRRYPIKLRWLHDSLYIVATDTTHWRLLGARVIAFGDTPALDALERVRPLTSYFSTGDLRERAALLLARADVQHAVGLQLSREEGRVTLMLPDGRTTSAILSAVPPDAPAPALRAAPVPFHREQPDASFWMADLRLDDALYLRHNGCRDADVLPELAQEILSVLNSRPRSKLIVDVRGTGCGGPRLTAPLLEAVRTAELGGQERLWVLIDAGTSSGATLDVASLRQLGATLVGEPTGDAPGGFGELRQLVLPHSGMRVQYPTRHLRGSAEPIAPDIHIAPSMDDLRSGRDPVLEAVLANR